MKSIEMLAKELIEAAEAYYHTGVSLMTDEEYDSKLEYLETLVEENDIKLPEELQVLFSSPSAGTNADGTMITHKAPMLSLAKAKNEDELRKYHEKLTEAGAKGFTLQTKLDGLAMSATYVDGKLSQIATRGDGTRGELMNYLINNKDLIIKHLPTHIETDYAQLELRGEVFARHSQFDVFNQARKAAQGEEFANSRNAVAGMVKKAEGGLGYHAEITFVTYSAFNNGTPIDYNTVNSDVLLAVDLTSDEVRNIDIDPSFLTTGTSFNELMTSVNEFGKLRPLLDVPTDGVVIKPINEIEMLNKMGYTSHHPIAYMAYKYPGVKAITTIEEITVTVGKTGALTPQARVTPVEVDGSILTNFTCHNYNWLHEMGIREGATVFVTKANDVIPAIHSVIDPGKNDLPEVPTHCPVCDSKLTALDSSVPSKTIVCPNVQCSSRIRFYLSSILARTFLHIDGIGEVMLDALIEEGVLNSIVDLFKLDVNTMKDVVIGKTSTGNDRKLGEGRAKNIRASIENAMKNTPDFRLLASLGIDGIGPNSAKTLINHFGSLQNVLNADISELSQVPGFGEVKVDNIVNNQPRLISLMKDLTSLGVVINEETKSNEPSKGTFSVSGGVEGFANRADFVDYMEKLGWEFHKSPKKDTDVLFADPNGTSSKVKKARANGTLIIDNINDLNKDNE